MDILDKDRVVSYRLFREHCTFYQGMYVKDLSEVGRDMRDLLIIDNSPTAYLFQPENALPISSWYEEKADRCLFDYIPFLKELSKVNDVRTILRSVNEVEASTRNADPSDDGAGGDSNQHLVFLEHGIEAIRAEVGLDSAMAREEQKSQIENFSESMPNDTSRFRTMKRVSHASVGSERSTPHVTVPDSEADTMLAGIRPGNLSSYSR